MADPSKKKPQIDPAALKAARDPAASKAALDDLNESLAEPPPEQTPDPTVAAPFTSEDPDQGWMKDRVPPPPENNQAWSPGEAEKIDEKYKADHPDPPPPPKPDTSHAVGYDKSADDKSADDKSPTPPPAPQQTVNVPATVVPKVAPRLSEMIGVGEEGQLVGANEQEKAESDQADALAAAKEQSAEDMRVQQMLDSQDRDKQRQALDDHLAQIQARSDTIAAKKINPHEFFDKLSFGQQILGVIGMALGGFANGFSDGRVPNAPMEMMNKFVNDSIEAQKANLENDRHGLDSDKDLYANKLRMFGDDEKAKAAARQEALAAAVQQIDALAAKYNSPIIKARADQLKGQLLQQFGHDQATLETYIPQHQVTTGGMGWNGGFMKLDPSEVLEYPPGSKHYISIAKEDRERVIQQISATDSVRQAVDDLETLAKVPLSKRGLSWNHQFNGSAEIVAKAEQATGGKGGKGLLEKNMDTMKLTLGLFPVGVREQLTRIKRNADETRDAFVKQSALYDVTPVLVPNKKDPTIVEPLYHVNGAVQWAKPTSSRESELDKISSAPDEDPKTVTAHAPSRESGVSPTAQSPGAAAPVPQYTRPKTSGAAPASPKGKSAGGGKVPSAPAGRLGLNAP